MDDKPVITFEDDGRIVRYDWHQIEVLYLAGHGVTDITRTLTKDNPSQFTRVRNSIAQRSTEYDWPESRAKIMSGPMATTTGLVNKDSGYSVLAQPEPVKKVDTVQEIALSQSFVAVHHDILRERKNRYVDVVSELVDRGARAVQRREHQTLEQVTASALLLKPVHELARDVHGIGKESAQVAIQINGWAGQEWAGAIPDVPVDEPSKPDSTAP